MSDVFISYSRKNSDFVHKLDDALTHIQREVWVDWQGIARGEDWWHSIQVGIDSADTALIVITESWLVSEICQRELDYIRKQNKRVFPIIRQKIEGDTALRVKGTWVDEEWEQQARDNWKYLSSLNWLFFDDDNAFDQAFADLLTALDTDQVYVKNHTRYLVQALEWQQVHHNPSFLLEGDQLTAAKTWLDSSAGKHPEPNQVHYEYIKASEVAHVARTAHEKGREQLIKRSRQASIGLGVAVVVAMFAALVVGQQFLSARAEVTVAVATLQQVNLQVTAAINQQVTAAAQVEAAQALVSTATIEQGNAILAQQTSAAGEMSASTRVAVAGATISPVAPTLTAVASAIADANEQQDVALALANASLELSSNNVEGALQMANTMVADYPDQSLAYVGRGTMLDRADKIDEALADYTRAIELDPERADAYSNRAQIYDVQGNHEQAIEDFTHAIANDPNDENYYLLQGQIYMNLGELDAAIDDFTKAIGLSPQNAELYFVRAAAYTYQDEVDKANADYFKGYEVSKSDSQTVDTVTAGKIPFTSTFTMTTGISEIIPFEAKAGQRIEAQANVEEGAGVDPVLIIVDPEGKMIFVNNDKDLLSASSAIMDAVVPTDGVYSLYVGNSSDGSDSDVEVTLDLKPADTLTPTPQ